MYLALDASLPPLSLVPKFPLGNNKFILFDPIKSYAIFTIVFFKLSSP